MPPQLVVADAPFKVYPGGVIALRCADWMGGARGSLSSETDARAITGEAVRDTQTVATSIFTSPVAAYQAADDTLEIDFASLPVESAPTDGMRYIMLASLLIEGDWDTANDDTYRGSTQHAFLYGCEIGFHGVPFFATDATFGVVLYKPRHRPHYVVVSMGRMGDIVGDEILHVRAYARSGTSIEILLDQIFLIPHTSSGPKIGEWDGGDFQLVPGSANTFGDIEYNPPTAGGFEDGVDGGDVNGKFTWMPFPEEEHTDEAGGDGGGDYQKSPDNEYMVRVVDQDFYYLVNTVPAPDVEATARAYSVHGSNYRDAEWWMEDDFSRTVASGWGTSPQGFGWWGTVSPGASVDGTRGLLNVGGVGVSSAGMGLYTGFGTGPTAAIIRPSDLIVSGTFEYSAIPTSAGSAFDASTILLLQDVTSSDANFTHELVVDPLTGEWWLQGVVTGGREIFSSIFDISSWFGAGATVGWKIEIKRYLLRAKVWDASGSEPAGWDYEDFPPIRIGLGASLVAYPYADDLEVSTSIGRKFDLSVSSFANDASVHTTYWDEIKVGSDPYGTPGDMTAMIEKPHGTEVGEIDIPYGAWQMVYWGTRDWTVEESGFPAYLDFSAKVWNEVGAAELQRAEALFWYFRSIHGGGIVSMNWSSALPADITRVHG